MPLTTGSELHTIMKNLSIRAKLILLGGIPVLGAILLAVQIVADARAQVQKNESLGTIEHVAQLSEALGSLVNELQLERAFAARVQGQMATSTQAETGDIEATRPKPRAQATTPVVAGQGDFQGQISATLAAQKGLAAMLGRYDLAKLPVRLAYDVREATTTLKGLDAHRKAVVAGPLGLEDTVGRYQRVIRTLIEGIAALSELTDNGELLRLTTSLVSVLQLKERGSQEHALLAYVFEVGSFPPGSYRELVTLATEERVFFEAFKTIASEEQAKLYDRHVTRQAVDPALKLRSMAIETTDEQLNVDANQWMRVQREKLSRIALVERELHSQVGAVALQRIGESSRAEWTSALLVGAVILTSMLLALGIALGITRRVAALRGVAADVGGGNLRARVKETTGDELGALGKAFNEMIAELARARHAMSNQIRMARELEIASSLQRSMLPPAPAHPDFDFAGRMLPADEVGGDFYDVLRAPSDDAMWVTIGDVSGHGIDAGLVMLMTQSAFASQFCSNSEAKPGATLCNVNRLLCENITERLKDKKYVTTQVFAYRGQGRFVYAGAHQPAIVYRANSQRCEVIDVTGAWLGIDPSLAEVAEGVLELAPGDILCLYTDGLPEARNEAGELFDMDRFVKVVEDSVRRFSDLDEAAAAVFATVEEHSPVRDDDWTLLFVRRRVATSSSAAA
jgi:serine phosphatase RsbU (regulator of sigma subunit)